MITNNVINEIGELLKSEYNINAKIGFPSPTESGIYLNEYNAIGGDYIVTGKQIGRAHV